MEPGRGLVRRRITFKCGASCEMVARTEADMDEEEARWSQQDCFQCRLEDGTITDYELDVLAVSVMYSELLALRHAHISSSRMN